MAGTYTEATRPTLPGAYTRYLARRRTVVPPSPGGVVAVPFTHDWGPMDTPVLLESFDDFEAVYGESSSPARIAVSGAFTGEGLEGLGGASAVLAIRMGGSSAAKATVTLDNPAAADALTIRAKYEGDRGDRLKVLVSPITSNVQEVSILDGTVELESFTYTTNIAPALAGLRDRINAQSDYVEAVLVLEGTTGLAAGTFSLAGGDDGSTLTAADWTTTQNALLFEEFAFLAPFNLPWAEGASEPAPTIRSIVAQLVAWTTARNDAGHRFQLVVGGALDETPATAIARAAACASEYVITVGGPGVNDDTYGALSTAQLVPRIAGIRAQRGEGMAAHFARLAGTVPRPNATGTPVSANELESLVVGGVYALERDRYAAAPTRIVKDVNTYTADTTDKPRAIYGNPKFVLSMQQFATEAEQEIEREMIGKTVISQATREAAAARVLRRAKVRERMGAFQPGTIVEAVPGNPEDEFIDLRVTLTFGRALAQLFIRGTVK
jgi:hypothetical protein